MPVPANLYLTMRRTAQGFIYLTRSMHSVVRPVPVRRVPTRLSRHLYVFYLFRDKTLCANIEVL